jgi:ubiquinone/menaquinone biosynthesis C-methylase UbiE
MPELTDYKNLLKRYASYAPSYDRKWGRYSMATLNRALEAIAVEGNTSLIDVACGTGLFARMLRQHRPHLSITGIDISPEMLGKARQRMPDVRWRIGRAEALPVDSGEFDVLTCTNAFHLVQDARAALLEFQRVLRPGGRVVIVDWCRDFPVMKIRDAVLRFADRQQRQIRTLREQIDLFENCGFNAINAERFRAGLWGLMCIVAQAPLVTNQLSPQRQASRLREFSRN